MSKALHCPPDAIEAMPVHVLASYAEALVRAHRGDAITDGVEVPGGRPPDDAPIDEETRKVWEELGIVPAGFEED